MSLLLPLRRVALLIAFAAPLLCLAGTARAETPAPAMVQKVAIRNFAFAPQLITVAPGTTIVWINEDEDPHTVTANDKSFHSAAMDTDERFSFTFTRPGEFAYFCSLHPHMTGKIVVKG